MLEQALKTLASDGTLAIKGLAVTGDLVNSPCKQAFKQAADLIGCAAAALGLGDAPLSKNRKVWVIDGNHDYRLTGLFRRPWSKGVETGGFVTRHGSFADDDSGLLVVGLNSAGTGILARGYIPLDEISRLSDEAAKTVVPGRPSYRIALVHHHLLPLPEEPNEMRGHMENAQSIVSDAGTKLLKTMRRWLLNAYSKSEIRPGASRARASVIRRGVETHRRSSNTDDDRPWGDRCGSWLPNNPLLCGREPSGRAL